MICNNDSRKLANKLLHFHHFPVNAELKKRWIIAIRRDEGPDFGNPPSGGPKLKFGSLVIGRLQAAVPNLKEVEKGREGGGKEKEKEEGRERR